ncbi:hypothetical protein CRG98_005610 [Punica granatum]|uniref:Uncharacterized protein n=1 Tax=Punica granatum TaxID=22663 RepID=A0A2I0L073_PUNGR|nr:hypothetical protein CRG98_005610 [Punica granatum]
MAVDRRPRSHHRGCRRPWKWGRDRRLAAPESIGISNSRFRSIQGLELPISDPDPTLEAMLLHANDNHWRLPCHAIGRRSEFNEHNMAGCKSIKRQQDFGKERDFAITIDIL